MTLNEQIKSALKNNKIEFIKHLVEERNFNFSIYDYHFVEYASNHSNEHIWKYLLDNIDRPLVYYERFAVNLMKRNHTECLKVYVSKNADLSFKNNKLLKLAYHKEVDDIFYLLIQNNKILNLIKEEKEDNESMVLISPFKKEDHKEVISLCKKILNKANIIKVRVF
tara:strand:- start:33520 stop:34020 length:501 start_codon:yes stop_codon:yes gene_type:complete